MAVPNLSEIVTSTLRKRTGKPADNVSENRALLNRLMRRKGYKKVSGGRTIIQELDFQANSTVKTYSGYEELDISPTETLTAAEFNWKQYAASVSMNGLEEMQNSGKESVIDLLEHRVKNMERSLSNTVASDCYSDGTGNGSKQIGGLQHLVSDTPTSGVVGGIDRNDWTFWRNIAFDPTAMGGAAADASNIKGYMNRVWVQLSRDGESPDLIVADDNYFRYYLESLQSIQRIASDEMAKAGFTSLKYMNADVVLDGGYGGACPTDHLYFLNTKFLFLKVHKDKDFAPLSPDRFAVNQDAMVRMMGWGGNMTMSCAFLQGVITDS